MATQILLKNITSADLNVSTTILANKEPAVGKIGSKIYLVIGDGITQAKDLPKFAADSLAEWGTLTGNITAQSDLMTLLANKIDRNFGTAKSGKILVVGEDGNVTATINIDDLATKTALSAHENNKSNPHAVTAGQTGAYTKEETDSAIAKAAVKEFTTNPAWEAADLATLKSWINTVTNVATDPINSRTVDNFDVYLSLSDNMNYYYDSGAWVPFTPDLSKYYTKDEIDDSVVKLTGAQTVSGKKTFTAEPSLPSKMSDAANSGTKPATEAQVWNVAQNLAGISNAKLDKNLGSENAGALLGTDASGNIAPITVIDGGTI